MTSTSKVVIVNGPEHDATESFFADIDGLVHDNGDIVVTDPKVVLVGVGTDLTRVGSNHFPVLLVDAVANLIVDPNIRLVSKMISHGREFS